ncbi:Histone acetyltransferase subunit NuA4 [Aspergillus sp. HF37]|nr:Histone acetyltransferase subunit NuA4 [Aspergillus sp. HF37]
MAENQPAAPNTPANANANNTDPAPTPATGGGLAGNPNNNPNPQSTAANSSRGLPYYEKLRRDLRDTLQRKRLMDKSMSQLEDQIYGFEQSYLEETTAGNIIKGFDNYIKGSSTGTGFSSATGLALGLGSAGGSGTGGGGGGGGGGGNAAGNGVAAGTRRKAPVLDSERVFSRSSASYLRDSPTPSSAQTTPSHANTPSSMPNGGLDPGSVKAGGASKNKKKAAGGNKEEDVGDEDKPPMKRLKITYSRE